jgi:hypothetical protein
MKVEFGRKNLVLIRKGGWHVACWGFMEFFKRTEEMVATAGYHCAPFLWDHYCIRQRLGNSTLYLHPILIWGPSC